MQQQIKEILVNMGILETAITENARLVYDLGLDSLDLTEFLMLVEEKFKIVIPDSEQEQISTIGELITYLEQHTKKVAASAY